MAKLIPAQRHGFAHMSDRPVELQRCVEQLESALHKGIALKQPIQKRLATARAGLVQIFCPDLSNARGRPPQSVRKSALSRDSTRS